MGDLMGHLVIVQRRRKGDWPETEMEEGRKNETGRRASEGGLTLDEMDSFSAWEEWIRFSLIRSVGRQR